MASKPLSLVPLGGGVMLLPGIHANLDQLHWPKEAQERAGASFASWQSFLHRERSEENLADRQVEVE